MTLVQLSWSSGTSGCKAESVSDGAAIPRGCMVSSQQSEVVLSSSIVHIAACGELSAATISPMEDARSGVIDAFWQKRTASGIELIPCSRLGAVMLLVLHSSTRPEAHAHSGITSAGREEKETTRGRPCIRHTALAITAARLWAKAFVKILKCQHDYSCGA